MNTKLSKGIIVILVIAASFVLSPFSLPVWICLVWMVWKKNTSIFHDHMEPEIAERRLKMLKTFLLVAGISLAILVVILLVANILRVPAETMDNVVIYIVFSFIGIFSIATFSSLAMLLIGRQQSL